MRFLRSSDDMDNTPSEDFSQESFDSGNATSFAADDTSTGSAGSAFSNEFCVSDEAPAELTPAILDVIDALIVVLDRDGRIVMFNRACEESMGYSFEEIAGTAVWERLIPSEEAAGVQEVFENLRSGDYPNRYENRWITKDGRERVIAWSNTAICQEDGAVRYVIGTGIDVTDKRLAEDGIRWRTEDLTLINTLSESANRGDDLRTISRLLSLGTRKGFSPHGATIYLLDETGTHLTIEGLNLSSSIIEEVAGLLGMPSEGEIVVSVRDCPVVAQLMETGVPVHLSGSEEMEDYLRQVLSASNLPSEARKAALEAVPLIRKAIGVDHGTLFPMISEGEPLGLLRMPSTEPLTDVQTGRMAGLARQVAGIIRHRRSEQALKLSEARLAEAQRIAGIGHWTWDITRGKRFWSDEFYRILGRTRDECPPSYENFIEAVHPDDRDRVRSALDRAHRTRRRYSVDHRIIRPDGSVLTVRERGEFKFDESGKPLQMIGTTQDVTKESRAKELQGVLLTIAQAVNHTESLEDLLAAIHKELGRLIDTTNFYVAVFDEDTCTYSFPYHIDEYDDATELGPTYLGKSLTDYVRRKGEPLLVDERTYEELIASGEVEQIGASSTAWLGVPLKSGGKDIGVVAVQSYQKVSPYTPYDLRLMSFVSDNIAMAVGRKLAEEQVNQRLHMEETISDVASGLIKHGVEQTDESVNEALSSAGSLLGAKHCFMWLSEHDEESPKTYEWCPDGVRPLLYELADVIGSCGRALENSIEEYGFVRVDEPSALPPEAGSLRHLLESNDLGSLLAVPVSEGGSFTGFVGVLGLQLSALSAQSVTFLRTLAAALASAVERRKADVALRSSFESLRSTVDGTVDALSRLGEARDPYTAGHQQRVADISCAIAEEMGLPSDLIDGIRVASKLHDIGKIHVPGEILSKPGKLNDLEFGIIKTHPKVGYEILRAVEFPWPVAEVACQHHERLDGSGYPDGLKGEDILPEARIVAVADVVEAMCTHRPYRPALPVDVAIEELVKNRGKLYGPTAVDACLKLMRTGRLKLGG